MRRVSQTRLSRLASVMEDQCAPLGASLPLDRGVGGRRQGSGGHVTCPAEASAKAGKTKMQSPDAKMRRGNEEVWLFEIVNR
jgi:hypothetical protein